MDGHLVPADRKADCHRAVDAAERFADGRATERDAVAAFWAAADSLYGDAAVAGAGRAELRKAAADGDDAGWAGRGKADEMMDEDAEAFEVAAEPGGVGLEADRGEDEEDDLNDVFDPFRDVASLDAAEVGEAIGRQVLLLVRTRLGRGAEAQERAAQAGLVRDLLGDPARRVAFDPAWQTPTVTGLAASIYDSRAFHDLPVLADAQEDAGCDDADVLGRRPGDGAGLTGCRN